jgi:hypothetical protein
MKRMVIAIAIATGLVAAAPARAEIGTADVVPAATLLLPYFEVDLGNPNGVNTVFTVNNASASAAVANVTVWTDWGVPSLGFQIYLTGYDMQTVDLRKVFAGNLPVTADHGIDPPPNNDKISPRGQLSQDINFPGSIGPCGTQATLYDQPDPTLPLKIQNLQRVHQGLSSPLNGQCWGGTYGDQIARGYVTVDSVTQCTLLTPADVGYVQGVVDYRNILWGDYAYVNPAQNLAQGDTLVHIEACVPGNGYSGSVGDGAGLCPLVPGDYSFYGRYVGATAADQREPLATTFAARYQGGKKTDFLVWRDTKLGPSGTNGPRPCGSTPSWFPLSQSDVVGFDMKENPVDLCFLVDNVSPPIGGVQSCFPLATQRVNVKKGNPLGKKLKTPFNAGFVYVNLNHSVAGDPFPGVAQGWVTVIRNAGGTFSTGNAALQLDNALSTIPNGYVIIP